jgi:hypothetical protein
MTAVCICPCEPTATQIESALRRSPAPVVRGPSPGGNAGAIFVSAQRKVRKPARRTIKLMFNFEL